MTKKYTLFVDLGNSAAKWALLERGEIEQQLSPMSKQSYLHDINATFFEECWRTIDKPENIFVSSVAKEQVWLALEEACEKRWSLSAEKIISTKEGFGLRNAYKQPADLGSDRWCGMIGALAETKSDFIVADCGSAITVDVVSSLGQHLGGYILPGLAMMKKSLSTDTADVELESELTKPSLLPESSTIGCVESAVHLAAVKLIESVYEEQLKKNEAVECFITGGDAVVLAELLSIKCVMMPDLVIRGLAVIAKKKKNEGKIAL